MLQRRELRFFDEKGDVNVLEIDEKRIRFKKIGNYINKVLDKSSLFLYLNYREIFCNM